MPAAPGSWRARLTAFAGHLRADPEPVVVISVAVVVAVLGIVDVIDDVKILVAATLGVLAVVGFSLFRLAIQRRADASRLADVVTDLGTIKAEVEEVAAAGRQAVLVTEIPSGKPIRRALEEAVESTSMWYFRGGTGSFGRAWTLPQLAVQARENAGSRYPIHLQVLDPNDDELCARYAQHRTRLARVRGRANAGWTSEKVRMECLATILAATWYSQHEFLDVHVALRREYSVVRLDVFSSVALLTNEDADYPALLIRRTSPAYRAFLAELQHGFAALPALSLPDVGLPGKDEIGAPDVQSVISEIGCTAVFADAALIAIRDLAFERPDPYPQA